MVNKNFKLFLTITICLFLLDRLTKYFVYQHKPYWNLTSFFGINYATNTGISFGLLQGYPWVPLLISIGVILTIVIWYKHISSDKKVQIGVGLVLAGALGNVLDRLLYGFVIDFIDFKIWPSFNIADSAIVIGAVLIIICVEKYKIKVWK